MNLGGCTTNYIKSPPVSDGVEKIFGKSVNQSFRLELCTLLCWNLKLPSWVKFMIILEWAESKEGCID